MKNILSHSFFLRSGIHTIIFAFIVSSYAIAQPHLVKDVNASISQNNGSNPSQVTNGNGIVFFVASDPDFGTELWKSDGSQSGTIMIKDINPGLGTSFPQNLVSINGIVFFSANDGINGTELWKTDGTANGTVLVKDIFPGTGSSSLIDFVVLGTNLFFSADDGVHGKELWRSDGTAGGTTLVKDIQPGSAASFTPPHFFNSIFSINGVLIFEADDGVNGNELWKSDGTEAGTVLLKDITPGSASSTLLNKIAVGNKLCFLYNDTVHGTEPWICDGTALGTALIKDINPGAAASNASYFTLYKGAIYFRAIDTVNGSEIWKSDGTSAGTSLLKDINPGIGNSGDNTIAINPILANVKTLFVSNDLLYFSADDGVKSQSLWKSDGTSSGTTAVKEIGPYSGHSITFFAQLNNIFYFTASTTMLGLELWKSDGTAAGTIVVQDINAGTGSSGPSSLTVQDGLIYFDANDGIHGGELWKTDGIQTTLVKDINTSSVYAPEKLTTVDTKLYFTNFDETHGQELWISDGTDGGTVLVKDIQPGTGNSNPDEPFNFNGELLFTADDGIHGPELWKSDGSDSGTALVRDINPGPLGAISSAGAFSFTSIGSMAYFLATSDPTGSREVELWKSDGTLGGTNLVKDVTPGSFDFLSNLMKVNNTLYFLSSFQLWKSDGTTGGTVSVTSFSLTVYSQMIDFNSKLFLLADDGISGPELWTSDGTSAGTVLVKDIHPGTGSQYTNIVGASNSLIYLYADDGIHGFELWKSDGTSGGTQLVKDINPGVSSSGISVLGTLNNILYFAVNDGVHGTELWRSDGTSAGTVLVKDINMGTGDSSPSRLVAIGSNIYFSANDGIHGTELWRSDGTASGTVLVGDIKPGILSSQPVQLTALNSLLFFVAANETNHSSLWAYDPTTQGITFDPIPDKLPSDAPFSLQATASSALPVSFSVVSGPATIIGNTVTLTGATGTVVVRASQPGNGDYKPASDVTRSFNVGVVLGVKPSTESIIAIFPIPTSDVLHIEVSEPGLSTYSLFDTQGRSVMNSSFENVIGTTIPLRGIIRGFYLLQIRTGTRSVTKKVLLE